MGKGIDENVKQLRSALEMAEANLRWPSGNLRKFWLRVRELNEMLRILTPVPSAERKSIRSELDAPCDKAREIGESWDNNSRVTRELVESKVAAARVRTKGHATDLRKAQVLLDEAFEWMNNGWVGFSRTTQLTSVSLGKMNQRDHDACWRQWQEANEAIHWKYREVCDFNSQRFRSEALEASGNAKNDPELAKEQAKATQRRMRCAIMSKDQFEDIRRVLDGVWSCATDAAKVRQQSEGAALDSPRDAKGDY